MRLIHLPVYQGGKPTGNSIDVASAMPLCRIPPYLSALGYRLILNDRGRLSVERLH